MSDLPAETTYHRWLGCDAGPSQIGRMRASIESRPVNSVWWLGVVAGGLEILLGFWASQQVVAARAVLLILFVGFWALFRGISEIVVAFEVKSAQDRRPAPVSSQRSGNDPTGAA